MQTSDSVEFVRLVGEEQRAGHTLASVSRHWQAGHERFLFISPHDDDAALGAGLLIQLAQAESVPVHILIVTDGAMGYCSEQERSTISAIRRRETFAAYSKLGVPRESIIWMGFPDCQLANFVGRRPAAPGEPAIAGHTGLQNALTHALRLVRPSQVFIPTHADLHPDHRIVHDELMISAFHAAGEIWPELGDGRGPLADVPHVNEFAVYCDFPSPARLRIRAAQAHLDCKLEALSAFASQRQIASVLRAVAAGGPEEYFRPYDLALYHPAKYRAMFDEHPSPRIAG